MYTVDEGKPDSSNPLHYVDVVVNYDDVSLISIALRSFVNRNHDSPVDELVLMARDMKVQLEFFEGLKDDFE